MSGSAIIFWAGIAGVGYAYAGYPLLLVVLGRLRTQPVRMPDANYTPHVTVLMPMHNEERLIRKKLENLLEIDYPSDRIEIIVVSDGSTDDSPRVVREYDSRGIRLIELPDRRGKAHALNSGLESANGEVIVFTDTSIMLDRQSIARLVGPLQDSNVGCVSGEDRIDESGGEGAYGKYELFLRRRESEVASIVGASGSFYAQRRDLCEPFREGMAPDFVSVLNTVEAGYRAVTAETAVGTMSALKNPHDEFNRKVRTLIRGYAALLSRTKLLNPFKYGLFSLMLISHKLIRWCVPMLLFIIFVANIGLVDMLFYQAALVLQIGGYAAAGAVMMNSRLAMRMRVARLCAYFVAANVAIAYAWWIYLRGTRVEIWHPSQRTDME